MTAVDDRALADRIVAAGVGETGEFDGRYRIGDAYLWPEKFVTDWRVAGALLEKFNRHQFAIIVDHMMGDLEMTRPRAVIEGCLLALHK